MTKEILDFYGLSFDRNVKEYLEFHTIKSDKKIFSTFRDSKTIPFHWVKEMPFDEVEVIQNNCKEAMKLWGYKIAKSAKKLSKSFVPLNAFPDL